MDGEAMYTRLKEYRIDFAYTAGNYYAASHRLKALFKKKEKLSKSFNISSAALGIMSLTALQLFILNSLEKQIAILIASGFTFLSIIISLGLFFYKNPEKYIAYHNRAEEYLMLYKLVKDNEAKFLGGQLSLEQLSLELSKINLEQKRINMVPLTDIIEVDYIKSGEYIKNGSRGYSEQDFKNT